MTATVKQTHWETPTFTVNPIQDIPYDGGKGTVKATGNFATVDVRVRGSNDSQL